MKSSSLFKLSKKERTVFICTTVIALVIAAAPHVLQQFFSSNAPATVDMDKQQAVVAFANMLVEDSIENKNKYAYNQKNYYKDNDAEATWPPSESTKLFYFNPNTATEAMWLELGVPAYNIHTINNFLHAGGTFKQPQDIYKIYGLNKSIANRLLPYIQINASNDEAVSASKKNVDNKTTYSKEPILSVDINTADSVAFDKLPAIGAVLSARIVKYRNKLGGFYSAQQIREVYGISDSAFQVIAPFLQIKSATIQPIAINAATYEQLKAHPYLYKFAGNIKAYQKQHGKMNSIDELKKIPGIDDALLSKIKFYFTVD